VVEVHCGVQDIRPVAICTHKLALAESGAGRIWSRDVS